MALRNVAVAYNDSPNSKEAVRLAVLLCERHGAALTALHIRVPLTEDPQVGTWMPDTLMESLRKASHNSVERAERGFLDLVSTAGFGGAVDWVKEDGDINDKLAGLARYFDLLVLGQYSGTGHRERFRARAENIVMRSGRPLLVVPPGYRADPEPTDRIAVAWDASQPATRALNDALQLFGGNNEMEIVSVVPKSKDSLTRAPLGRDVVRHLTLHGVDARRVTIESKERDVARALLQHCQGDNFDLLAMGAYGHARLREDLFGGVTKNVIENITIPLLMSH